MVKLRIAETLAGKPIPLFPGDASRRVVSL